MPRRSQAEKTETNERIVRKAAELFRKGGLDVGIAELMDELGLTHGGFYRHFASKDELIVAAVSRALDEVAQRLVRAAEAAPEGREREAIVTAYLSADHLAHPETWCAIAALAGDLARMPAPLRKKLDGAMMAYAQRLAPFMRGATEQERMVEVTVLLSGMAGAIAMIRGFGDRATRELLLGAVRATYLQRYA